MDYIMSEAGEILTILPDSQLERTSGDGWRRSLTESDQLGFKFEKNGWPEPQKRRSVSLHGHLAEVCGPTHLLAYDTPLEAFRALCVQHKGFMEALSEGAYRVVLGTDPEGSNELDEERVHMLMGSQSEMHVVPVLGGSKSATGKIIMGIAMVGLVLVTGGASAFAQAGASAAAAGGAAAGTAGGFSVAAGMAAIGGGGFAGASVLGFSIGSAVLTLGSVMLLSGVAMALAPKPKLDKAGGAEDQKPSYLFNGAVNTTQEGGPVPLAFGESFVGSQVVSALITVETTRLDGSIYGSTNPLADLPWIYSEIWRNQQ